MPRNCDGDWTAACAETARNARTISVRFMAAPVLFQHALVTTERNTTGTEVMLKGIEGTRARSSPMLAKIVGPRGAFDTAAGERGVAVGKYLATKLGVRAGSSISITVPTDS